MFCEKGVFNREQTEQILKAGVDGGLAINFHGDELTDLGSGEVSDVGSERHLLYLFVSVIIVNWIQRIYIQNVSFANLFLKASGFISKNYTNSSACLINFTRLIP